MEKAISMPRVIKDKHITQSYNPMVFEEIIPFQEVVKQQIMLTISIIGSKEFPASRFFRNLHPSLFKPLPFFSPPFHLSLIKLHPFFKKGRQTVVTFMTI